MGQVADHIFDRWLLVLHIWSIRRERVGVGTVYRFRSVVDEVVETGDGW